MEWDIVFEMSTRRDFVKMTCGICAAITGAGIISTALQSCATFPMVRAIPSNGKITVPESSFTPEVNYILVRCKDLENDILVVRNSPEKKDYWGLLMRCTHQQNPLSVQKQIIHCPAHGSEFDLNGMVVKDPAINPLKKYLVEAKDNLLVIDLNS